MANFTSCLVGAMKILPTEHCATLFKNLTHRVQSKNRNKLLLKLYTSISEQDPSRNAAFLSIICSRRIYQQKEDEEGHISGHISQLLNSLEDGEGYRSVAIPALKMNVAMVDLERMARYCDGRLLGVAMLTYHKIGRLPMLVEQLIALEIQSNVMDELAGEELSNVVEGLTETQTEALLSVPITYLTSWSEREREVKKVKTEQRDVLGFVVRFCEIVLSSSPRIPGTEILAKIHRIVPELPKECGDLLRLYFNDSVLVQRLPESFLCQVNS
eukprot:sb/3468161/